jgi:hypothetical protein
MILPRPPFGAEKVRAGAKGGRGPEAGPAAPLGGPPPSFPVQRAARAGGFAGGRQGDEPGRSWARPGFFHSDRAAGKEAAGLKSGISGFTCGLVRRKMGAAAGTMGESAGLVACTFLGSGRGAGMDRLCVSVPFAAESVAPGSATVTSGEGSSANSGKPPSRK